MCLNGQSVVLILCFLLWGGSFDTEKKKLGVDAYDVYHANVKMGSLGLRLVCYPKEQK